MCGSFQIPNALVMYQPHFLPWLPYIAKIASASDFLVLDDVQFRKYYYQNRTRLKNRWGRTFLLTIPVTSSTKLRINQVRIAKINALKKAKKTLYQTYCKAPYFWDFWNRIDYLLGQKIDRLLDLNLKLIELIFALIELDIPNIHLSSKVVQVDDRTERIVEACSTLGTHYLLVGWGGATTVHDIDRLSKCGIRVVQLKSRDIDYQSGSLYEGLSILDTLFVHGKIFTRSSIKAIADLYIRKIQGRI